jgi:ABC-2 type transport system ATP-binding protein
MPALSFHGLTKRFGSVAAVDDLTFDVASGRITGFLGPNGAGKTTTLRMLVDLVQPTSGSALIGDRHYRDLERPRSVVGSLLEATGLHPGRTGRNQLRILGRSTGATQARIDDLLSKVDLLGDADRRVGVYSLGMKQRLGLAGALLGDPEILVLDEPANGLDPAGMAWLRSMLRSMAAEGRTILVSTHVLSEVSQTVDDIVIINDGRLRFTGALTDLAEQGVTVRTAELQRLHDVLVNRGFEVGASDSSSLRVANATGEQIGEVAAKEGIVLSNLSDDNGSLEEAFLRLTGAPAV